jgi:hypothetical protein
MAVLFLEVNPLYDERGNGIENCGTQIFKPWGVLKWPAFFPGGSLTRQEGILNLSAFKWCYPVKCCKIIATSDRCLTWLLLPILFPKGTGGPPKVCMPKASRC